MSRCSGIRRNEYEFDRVSPSPDIRNRYLSGMTLQPHGRRVAAKSPGIRFADQWRHTFQGDPGIIQMLEYVGGYDDIKWRCSIEQARPLLRVQIGLYHLFRSTGPASFIAAESSSRPVTRHDRVAPEFL